MVQKIIALVTSAVISLVSVSSYADDVLLADRVAEVTGQALVEDTPEEYDNVVSRQIGIENIGDGMYVVKVFLLAFNKVMLKYETSVHDVSVCFMDDNHFVFWSNPLDYTTFEQ